MPKVIGSLGVIDNLVVGNRTFTDLSSLITLVANTNATNNFSTFRKAGTGVGAGYQVTAGKTLFIYAVTISTAGASSEVALAQSDNDVGLAATTALGNPVYFGTESSSPGIAAITLTTSAVSIAGQPLGRVLATKYLTANSLSSDGALVYAYGYEI